MTSTLMKQSNCAHCGVFCHLQKCCVCLLGLFHWQSKHGSRAELSLFVWPPLLAAKPLSPSPLAALSSLPNLCLVSHLPASEKAGSKQLVTRTSLLLPPPPPQQPCSHGSVTLSWSQGKFLSSFHTHHTPHHQAALQQSCPQHQCAAIFQFTCCIFPRLNGDTQSVFSWKSLSLSFPVLYMIMLWCNFFPLLLDS